MSKPTHSRTIPRNNGHSGRSVDALLSDFGHQLPRQPEAAAPAHDRTPLFRPANRRGPLRRNQGWAPSLPPVAGWRMTSDQAPALWPFVAGPGLPPTGAQIGVDDFSGGAFYADPVGWTLDDSIPVTNTNVFCFGDPGRGKSGTTKAFVLRMSDFGYKTLILGDIKDEYESLCHWFGVEPIAVGQGLRARINPLDFGPLIHGWENLTPAEARTRATVVFGRWGTLVRGLVGSQKVGDVHVPYGPTEARVVDQALRTLTGYADGQTRLTETTLPALSKLIEDPSDELVNECRYANRRQFLDDTRLLRDALNRLVRGVLAGIFDAHTTIDVDWTAPIQSLSLSRLKPLGDEAVAIALACTSSWGRGVREVSDPNQLNITIRDEVWLQLRLGPDAVKSFDADLRLSRSEGSVQWCNMHHPANFEAIADAGSQSSMIARDLAKLASTTIYHGIDDPDAVPTSLGPVAHHAITEWACQNKGRALWKVGDRQFRVQTVLHPAERALFDTNEALAGKGPEHGPIPDGPAREPEWARGGLS